MTRILPKEPGFDPARWDASEDVQRFSRGIELFNAGEYEEAHEEFERLWLSGEGAESDFFKGLIQACIALHHFRRGNLDGAAGLYVPARAPRRGRGGAARGHAASAAARGPQGPRRDAGVRRGGQTPDPGDGGLSPERAPFRDQSRQALATTSPLSST